MDSGSSLPFDKNGDLSSEDIQNDQVRSGGSGNSKSYPGQGVERIGVVLAELKRRGATGICVRADGDELVDQFVGLGKDRLSNVVERTSRSPKLHRELISR